MVVGMETLSKGCLNNHFLLEARGWGWGMARVEKCLLCKFKLSELNPHLKKKVGVVLCVCIYSLHMCVVVYELGTDGISGAPWPASLVDVESSRPVRKLV